jgi:hypothetical protein
MIYQHRPKECTLLKCWDTADLEKVLYQELLNRSDIIPGDGPIQEYITLHESECSLAGLGSLLFTLPVASSQDEVIAELTNMVQKDMAIRARALASSGFQGKTELLVFGRPLFIILQNFGIRVQEMGGTLVLQFIPEK